MVFRFITCNPLLVTFSAAIHTVMFTHTLLLLLTPVSLTVPLHSCVGLTSSRSLWNIFSYLGPTTAGLLCSQNEDKLWPDFQGRDGKGCLRQTARNAHRLPELRVKLKEKAREERDTRKNLGHISIHVYFSLVTTSYVKQIPYSSICIYVSSNITGGRLFD